MATIRCVRQWASLSRFLTTSSSVKRVVQARVAEREAEANASTQRPWPDAMLAANDHLTHSFASELLFEVGWQARHVFVDLRPDKQYEDGRVRGALSLAFEPQATFKQRATDLLNRLPYPHDSGSAARVIFGWDANAAKAAAQMRDAGFPNAVHVASDFESWRAAGLPCDDSAGAGLDDFADSTF